MRKKWPRLFYTSMAIGLACILGLLVQIFSAATVFPSLFSFRATTAARLGEINILNLQLLTVPYYNSGNMSNDLVFDLSGAPDKTQVTGFSITADQSCDLELDKIDKTIHLSGGQATLVNLDDLISGTQGGDGISLKTFRALYSNTVIIQGKLKKNDIVVRNLAITIKL